MKVVSCKSTFKSHHHLLLCPCPMMTTIMIMMMSVFQWSGRDIMIMAIRGLRIAMMINITIKTMIMLMMSKQPSLNSLNTLLKRDCRVALWRDHPQRRCEWSPPDCVDAARGPSTRG